MKGVVASPEPAGLIPKDDFPPLTARLNGKQGKKVGNAAAASVSGMDARVVPNGIIRKERSPPLPLRTNGKQGKKEAAATSISGKFAASKLVHVDGIAESMNAVSIAQGVEPPAGLYVVSTAGLGVGTAGLVVGQKNAKLKMGSSIKNSGQQPNAQILGRNVDVGSGSGVNGSGVVGSDKGVVGSGKTASTTKPQEGLKGKNWAGLFKDNRAPLQWMDFM